MFVAVGMPNPLLGGSGVIRTSSDGVDWTTRQTLKIFTKWLFGVAYGNGVFVAVGDKGTIIKSPDGHNWDPFDLDDDSITLRGITYDNGLFIAVGSGGTIVTSSDGETWTQRTSNVSESLRGVTYGEGLYVAVGDKGTIVTSSNGIDWTEETSPTNNELFDVAYGQGRFVAVGSGGTILRSEDGKIWTQQTSNTTEYLNGVAYADGQFVVVGDNGTILTSPNGQNWTPLDAGISSNLNAVTFIDDRLFAVGRDVIATAGVNADLAGLHVKPWHLTPAFDPDIDAYHIDTSFTEIDVGLSTADPNADLAIDDKQVGSGIHPVTLNPGRNKVVISVTAQSGKKKDYKLTVAVVEPAAISIAANPTKVVADGTATATVTVDVTDNDGNPVADGTPVTFAVTDGAAVLASTHSNTIHGIASTEVSSTTAGSVTVTAGVPHTGLNGDVTITFTRSSNRASSPSAFCASARCRLDPSRGGIIVDPNGTFQLVIPAGAFEGVSGLVTINAHTITGPEARTILERIPASAGVRTLDFILEFQALAPDGSDITTFAQPLTLTIDLPDDVLAGVRDPEKLGLFRLNDDGTLTFIGGKLVDGKLIVRMYGFSRYVVAEVDITFADLDGHWANDDIELMAAKYVVQGRPGGRFDPEGPVTRAEFTAMLARALGMRQADPTLGFRDVQPGDWYHAEILSAAASGIVEGYDVGSFRPNDLVTREQAATIMARALLAAGMAKNLSDEQIDDRLAPFADSETVSAYARSGMALAIEQGIISGQSPDTLAPQAGATRAEAAAMIARFWRKGGVPPA